MPIDCEESFLVAVQLWSGNAVGTATYDDKCLPRNKVEVSWLINISDLDTSVMQACTALPVGATSVVTPELDCISTYLQCIHFV